MAVWGQFGGRLRKKASVHPTDSPECCKILLEAGANPNSPDNYQVTPLGTACGTGGARCIDMLVKHGADINYPNIDGATPLHETFFRGNIDCLERLLRYKPDSSLKHHKSDIVALDGVFRDNMYEILDYTLNDEEIIKVISEHDQHKDLMVTQDNVERLLHQALAYKAQECFQVLIQHIK